ncbi:helix-turn-helix domain-containing protein [Chryseolinea sp. Jin1]|uniref:Helix-turn-helix domain-containing protein n=2 Tax=Chryseolinea lacunae TaxID=2801331 RepID=A0ABS1KWC0_9BACT|nr:helix-turn-helix domain-containing protein [Chryseolinea lacunae]
MNEHEVSQKSTAPHQGRNVKRFRDMLGMKQETLATLLGPEWTQKKVSQLESTEVIDRGLLTPLAAALHVTPEAIEHFDGEKMLAVISNTFNTHDSGSTQISTNIVNNSNAANEELLQDIKKLYEALVKEKDSLLKEKDERIALLQRLSEK